MSIRVLYEIIVILIQTTSALTSSDEFSIHLNPFDHQETVEKCKVITQLATEVTLKGYVTLPSRTMENTTVVILDVRRHNSDIMKQFCTINMNACTKMEFQSKCYCKRQLHIGDFDLIFNFTNQIIFSRAEARMRLQSGYDKLANCVSNIQRLPAIYDSVISKLQINGNEVNTKNCFFKIDKDVPAVRFCCDAKHLPCHVSVVLDETEPVMQASCVEINLNDNLDYLTSSKFHFTYEICRNNKSATTFQCQPIFVNDTSRTSIKMNILHAILLATCFMSAILWIRSSTVYLVLNDILNSMYKRKYQIVSNKCKTETRDSGVYSNKNVLYHCDKNTLLLK